MPPCFRLADPRVDYLGYPGAYRLGTGGSSQVLGSPRCWAGSRCLRHPGRIHHRTVLRSECYHHVSGWLPVSACTETVTATHPETTPPL